MTLRTTVAVGLALALTFASPALAARQLNPSRSPQHSDQLSNAYTGCGDSAVRSQAGKFLGTATTCIYLYWFDRLQEIDPVRDYGVFWVQTSFRPVDGLCLTGMTSRASLPSIVDGHAHAPRGMNTARRKSVTSRLNVTADGNALTDGWIKQSLLLYPRKSRSSLRDERRRLDVVWSGVSKGAVASAFGLEFSAATLDKELVGIDDLKGGLVSISGYLHPRC